MQHEAAAQGVVHQQAAIDSGRKKAASIHFADGELDPEFVCTVCRGPLIEPVRGACHHEFCRRCVAPQFAKCPCDCPFPGCRGTLSKGTVSEAPKTVRLMKKLRVHCVHADRGCCWIGSWGDLLAHVEQHCTFEHLRCPFPECGKIFERSAVGEHKRNCKYRAEQCRFCLRTFKYCDLALHETVCDLGPQDCPQHCGQTVPKQQMEQHIDVDCPNTIVPCPFHEIGCQVGAADGAGALEETSVAKPKGSPHKAVKPLRRADTEKHLEGGVHHHLGLLVTALKKAKGDHRREVEELRAELSVHRERVLEELVVGDQPVNEAVKGLNKRIEEQQLLIDRFTSGRVLTVDLHGGGTHTTIGDALTHSEEGDLILIRPGTYKESPQVLKPNIWIHGAGTDLTVIETAEAPLRLSAEGSKVSALTVVSHSKVSPCIHCGKFKHVIADCRFEAKEATLSAVVVASGAPVFKRCKAFGSSQHGILWKSLAVPGGLLEECEISDCVQSNVAVEGGELALDRCTVHSSSEGNGVWVQGGASVHLRHCDVHHNGYSNVDVVKGGSLIMENTAAHHSQKCGLCVAQGGKALVNGCHLHNNALPNVVLLPKAEGTFIHTTISHGQQYGLVAKAHAICAIDGNCIVESNALDNLLIDPAAQLARR